VLDPIDGTRALICGLPSWTTLVGLTEVGDIIAGFIDAPVLNELAIGLPEGSWLGEARLRTSDCADLSDARLATTDPFLFDDAARCGFEGLRTRARVTRYGLDALAYARLAAGQIDLVAETGLKRHDWHALVPVVRGAGGVIGNWRGGDDLSGGDILAASTPRLFEEAVTTLSS
jgi:myo-inositol-1(or 4)-monophosphatase